MVFTDVLQFFNGFHLIREIIRTGAKIGHLELKNQEVASYVCMTHTGQLAMNIQ